MVGHDGKDTLVSSSLVEESEADPLVSAQAAPSTPFLIA